MTIEDKTKPARGNVNKTRSVLRQVALKTAAVAQKKYGSREYSSDEGLTVHSTSDFELLETLGSGGMGVVYRARERDLARDVAVKKLHGHFSGSDRLKSGFRAEAIISGKLAHPNIVPIYGLSEENDQVAIAMKLVEGRSFEEVVRPNNENQVAFANQYDLSKKIEILISVCNAVSFAHSKGFIHRDIKPLNIMLGEFGEILLLDWGIALSIDDNEKPALDLGLNHKSLVTGAEGTLSYMAPEMLRGDGMALSVQTDVYLLGACLYEILSQKPPHLERLKHPESAFESEDPVSLSEVEPLPETIDRELREICTKALMPEPHDRFVDVKSFQTALRNYLKHRQSTAIGKDSKRLLEKAVSDSKLALTEANRALLYDEISEALHGFRQARILWEDNLEALAGERTAKMIYLKTAIELGDFVLAKSHLAGLSGDDVANFEKEIKKAEKEVAANKQSIRLFRRIRVASILLLLGTLSAGVLMFQSMKSTGHNVAMKVHQRLVDEGKHELSLFAKHAADKVNNNRQILEVALMAFAKRVEASFQVKNPPVDSEPLFCSEINAQNRRNLSFQVLEKYAGKEKKLPVTFDSLAYVVPQGETLAGAQQDINRISTLYPFISSIMAKSKTIVLRYFLGLEKSKLYMEFPGSGNKPDDYDPTKRQWYREASQGKGVILTPPYGDATTGKVVVSAVTTLYDTAGNKLGVAGIDTHLKDLLGKIDLPKTWADAAKIEIVKISKTAKRFALKVLFSKEYEGKAKGDKWNYDVALQEIEPQQSAELAKMIQDISERKSGVVKMARDGKMSLWAYAPLVEDNQYMMLTVEQSSLTAMARDVESNSRIQTEQALWQLIQTVGVIFFCLMIVIVLVTRKIY